MSTRRLTTFAAAALAGLGLAAAVTAPATAAMTGGERVAVSENLRPPNFWFVYSTHDTLAGCEAAAQLVIWPNNPAGADDYECRPNGNRWDLWLMFLS